MLHVALALAGLAATSGAITNSDVVWQWDRESLACVLRQEISPSGEKIEIRRTPGAEATGVGVIIPSHAQFRNVQHARGAIILTPGGETVGDVDQRFNTDKAYLNIRASTEDGTFMEKLSRASSLEISGQGIEPAKVTLKSAGAAVAALGQCEDRRMREWGIDPVSWRALKTGPKPIKPLIERISDIDYPDMALAYSVQSDFFIRLDVAPDGSLTSCKALNAAQYKGFEYATCDVMKGARFRPAIDSDSRAVSAPYIFEIRFKME